MKQKLKSALTIAYEQLGQTWFFVASLMVFCLHAAWLALSSNLLPYDEYYHIGIIKFYALQWSPFISHQPPEVSYLGDLTRLPSYMYHYLMSFPYRFFHLFTQNETVLTILLRFMNIVLVIGGVILFRRLFMRGGLSKRLVNSVCTFFLFTPFVVMLAAENNYDNLMFFMTPVVMWYAYKLIDGKKFVASDVFLFLSTGMFTSLVKHSFIVIFGAMCTYIFFEQMKVYKNTPVFKMKFVFDNASIIRVVPICLAVLVTSFLFMERFGINLLRYRKVDVGCSTVQTEEVCKNYSPWLRNSMARKNPSDKRLYGNPASFTQHWSATMMAGLYPVFAQIPHEPGSRIDPYGDYTFMPRLTVLLTMAYLFLTAGIVSFVLQYRRVRNKELLKFMVTISAVLVSVLFFFNYKTYLSLTRAYGVQVRYLYPMMLPMVLIFAFSINHAVKQVWVKKGAVLALLCIYIWCGGIVGWIIRSETNWYWPNQTVITVNQRAQKVLQRIVPN